MITLQTCMELIMSTGGGNSYKIPHINKVKLRRDDVKFSTKLNLSFQLNLDYIKIICI